jgi:UDP-2,3-diacylglucosamine pyrophosphatase LpxH
VTPASTPAPSAALPARNLLVLSDMHLGSDIGDWPAPPPPRCQRVDDDLCALLDHYRRTAGDVEPWDLIINGDFIDFIGISLDTSQASVSTEPTPEERAHGLGTAEDHACFKLGRVAQRHQRVFAALAAFVAAGHRLTIVTGNHDREFHWDRVRADLGRLLFRALDSSELAAPLREAEFLERVRFSSWFFWVEGVAYIEHGHQYDSFCASECVMAPLSPVDHRRLASGFTEVLLRFVVHPIECIRRCDHDRMGVLAYIALGIRLGVRGCIDLFSRYVCAIIELFRLRSHSLTEAAAALRREHERRLSHFAEARRIDLQRLRALVELQARPVTRSIRGIMASLLLDEIALTVLSVVAFAVLGLVGLRAHHFAWTSALVASAWWLGHWYLKRTRHVDPQGELAARAGPLARLFPAAFVVMGHTHVPVRTALDGGAATYVNTGSWAEAEGAPPDAPFVHRAARTHLVIRVRDTGPEAELLVWDSSTGPKQFAT